MMKTWTNVYLDIDFWNTYRDEISFQPLFASFIFIFLIKKKKTEIKFSWSVLNGNRMLVANIDIEKCEEQQNEWNRLTQHEYVF